MTTAQETFTSMMKEQIAPALRAMGFKGTGQTFALPDESHFAQVGFQKSTFSDSTAIRFTINVSVIARDEWAEARARKPHFPVKPSPGVLYGSQFWQQRVGRLLPTHEDTWWRLRAGMDTSDLADEVLAAVRDFVLPAMQEQLNGA